MGVRGKNIYWRKLCDELLLTLSPLKVSNPLNSIYWTPVVYKGGMTGSEDTEMTRRALIWENKQTNKRTKAAVSGDRTKDNLMTPNQAVYHLATQCGFGWYMVLFLILHYWIYIFNEPTMKGRKQKELFHSPHLLLTTVLSGDIFIIPILQMRILRPREMSNLPKRPQT